MSIRFHRTSDTNAVKEEGNWTNHYRFVNFESIYYGLLVNVNFKVVHYEKEDGTKILSVEITVKVTEKITGEDGPIERYLPTIYDVYKETSGLGYETIRKPKNLQIQTTSFGALPLSEYKKFFEAQQVVFEIAQGIKEAFLSNFEGEKCDLDFLEKEFVSIG